jgi:hypothetical protein
MKRPEAHQTGTLGEIRAAQFFTENGWIVAKNGADYGIDLVIQRADGSNLTGDFALVQVKATRSSRRRARAAVATVSLLAKHLDLWRSIPVPVFLAFVVLPSNDVFILDCHALAMQLGSAEQSPGSLSKSRSIGVPLAALGTFERMADLSRYVATFWTEIRRRSHRELDTEAAKSSVTLATTQFIGAMPMPLIGTLAGMMSAGLGVALGAKVGASLSASGVAGSVSRSKLLADLSPVIGSAAARRLVDGALQEST